MVLHKDRLNIDLNKVLPMKKFAFVVLALVSHVCAAEGLSIKISPLADFSQPERISSKIREECTLPQAQAEASRVALQTAGIAVETAPEDQLGKPGYYLQLKIEDAVSMGNAFIGHRKFVAMSAKLYKDGTLVDTFSRSRDSMGGVMGGFKGSCSVLERCSVTLGKDLATWIKPRLSL